MNPLVSVVIVNYNVKELILKCLNTIYNVNHYKNIEVIVVDNASTDGSVEEIKNNYPCILIENNQNMGFASANNQGIEVSQGELIFMLNPDTEVNMDAIEILVHFLSRSTDVVIAGPCLLNSDGTVQHSTWKFTTLWVSFLRSFSVNIKKRNVEKSATAPVEVESLSGAALFFRKEDWVMVKGLDEKFFWYEDDDFCFRLKKETEKKAYYVPQAEIVHHVSRSSRQDYRIPIANQLISRLKYFRKHFTSFHFLIIILITFLHVINHIIVFSLISIFSKKGKTKLKAYIFTMKKLFTYLSGQTKGIILP